MKAKAQIIEFLNSGVATAKRPVGKYLKANKYLIEQIGTGFSFINS